MSDKPHSPQSYQWAGLRRWTPRILAIAAAVALLWTLVVSSQWFFKHSIAAIRFPYPLDYGEGPLLDQTLRLARGENIYRRSLDRPPYNISNYPPLFLIIQIPFAWLFGPALWYGRAINLISILIAAAGIGLALWAMTRDRVAAAVGGLTLLLFPYIVDWSAFNRIDCLALGLSCAGLAVIAQWGSQRKGLIWGAVLLTAAVYTRQSYALAAPMAAWMWLLRQPPRHRAWELAAWVGGMGLGLFILLNLLTWGGFYFHIVTSNVNPFYWNTVRQYVHEMLEHMPALLLAGMLFMLIGAIAGRRRPDSWWMVAPYWVGAVLSSITIGKSGSNVNYLFELSAALSLVVGAWVAWAGKHWWLQAIVLLALIPQMQHIAHWTVDGRYGWIMGKINARQDIEKMLQIAQEADGPVLADEYMGLIPLAGKSIYFQPFEVKQLYLAGIWDEQAFLQDIENQVFSAMLIYDPPYWNSRKERWTERAVMYMERYYYASERLADTIIYRPYTWKLE